MNADAQSDGERAAQTPVTQTSTSNDQKQTATKSLPTGDASGSTLTGGDAGSDGLSLKHVVNFTWENLSYKVPVEDVNGNTTFKTLLFCLNGCAKGGRVLAIMGPSGAGKTTLMGAITGKLYNSSAILEGCCFMNNNVYQQRYKRLVSYVCQDDIAMGKDTPREAISFSARLRLGLDHAAADRRTEEVISRLSLTKCQHTYLGIPGMLKGVSGGEKKRANIGTELVTNPYIMLLDEPTTGLDSVNAVRVGQLMQDLAKKDMRTVVATVHCPSSELVDLFDDLLLLGKGHTVYHGPSKDAQDYFAALGFQVPEHTNPTEYYMALLQMPEHLLSQLWLAWEDYVLSDDAEDNPCVTPITHRITLVDERLEEQLKLKGANFGLQFFELFARSWRMYVRDPSQFTGRLAQCLFFAVFIGLFFFNVKNNQQGVQDRQGVLYCIIINNLFGATMVGVASFPPERAVFLQEQANDTYSAIAYFLAKNAAELPWQIMFPTLFEVTAYFMIHLYRSADAFFVHWFIIVLIGTFGASFGLMFATFFEKSQPVFALIPNIFLPLFIVSGLFANQERLFPYWEWLNYLSFPRHAYLGCYVNEFRRLKVICDPVTPTCRYANGDAAIVAMGFENWHYWQTFVSLIVYQLGLSLIGCLSLYIQGEKRRGKLPFVKNLRDRQASPRAVAFAQRKGQLTPPVKTPVNSIATPVAADTPRDAMEEELASPAPQTKQATHNGFNRPEERVERGEKTEEKEARNGNNDGNEEPAVKQRRSEMASSSLSSVMSPVEMAAAS